MLLLMLQQKLKIQHCLHLKLLFSLFRLFYLIAKSLHKVVNH